MQWKNGNDSVNALYPVQNSNRGGCSDHSFTGEVTVSALSSPYLSMLRDCKCLVRCQVSVCLSQFPWLKSGGTRASLGIPDHPVRSSKPLGKARIG